MGGGALFTDFERWTEAEARRRARFEVLVSLAYLAGVLAAVWWLC